MEPAWLKHIIAQLDERDRAEHMFYPIITHYTSRRVLERRREIPIQLATENSFTGKESTGEELQAQLNVDVKKLKTEVSRLSQQLEVALRHEEEYGVVLKEKNHVIQVLQDDVAALQLEISTLESKVEELRRENCSLVDRMLAMKEQEVENMNRRNEHR